MKASDQSLFDSDPHECFGIDTFDVPSSAAEASERMAKRQRMLKAYDRQLNAWDKLLEVARGLKQPVIRWQLRHPVQPELRGVSFPRRHDELLASERVRVCLYGTKGLVSVGHVQALGNNLKPDEAKEAK